MDNSRLEAVRVREIENKIKDNVLATLENALSNLQAAKPDERGELARRYAIVITEMEKVVAYYQTYIK